MIVRWLQRGPLRLHAAVASSALRSPSAFLRLPPTPARLDAHTAFRRCLASSAAAAPVSEPGAQEDIVFTDKCVKRVKALAAKGGKPAILRVAVSGGGCSGFQYSFALDENVEAGDRIFERDGVKIVVDDVSLGFLRGSVLDFEEEMIRSAFKIASNPNAAASCGCGSSFTAK
eukprot:tig00001339_g8281.t1